MARRPSIPGHRSPDRSASLLQACIDFIETMTFYALKESQSNRRSADTTAVTLFRVTPSYKHMIRLQTSSCGNNLVRWEEELSACSI